MRCPKTFNKTVTGYIFYRPRASLGMLKNNPLRSAHSSGSLTLHEQVLYRGQLTVLKVTVCHTAGLCGEEYDDWNTAIFGSRQNCSSDGAERTDDGRAFHAWAAVTEKARSPSVVRRVVGMTSVDVEALRRRRREPTSAVKWRVSAKILPTPVEKKLPRDNRRSAGHISQLPRVFSSPHSPLFQSRPTVTRANARDNAQLHQN